MGRGPGNQLGAFPDVGVSGQAEWGVSFRMVANDASRENNRRDVTVERRCFLAQGFACPGATREEVGKAD